MHLPNFFVIGAPKAGTTALYHTLRQHPEVYLSSVKEPGYFNCDGEPPILPGPAGTYLRRTSVWQPRSYALLFAGVTEQRAIGEASPIYLRSALAAHRIKKSLPTSRLIALLRQPAERAYSHYTFMRQHGVELMPSFERALTDENLRLQKGWFSGLHHKTNGYYFSQLSVYYNLFPREQIRVYLYEDWKNTPQAMLRDIFGFLEIDENFMPELRLSNVTRQPRSRRLHNLATHPEHFRRLTPFLPESGSSALFSLLRSVNQKLNLAPPPPLHPETRSRLTADYREDILQLQGLIGRDLSHWLSA